MSKTINLILSSDPKRSIRESEIIQFPANTNTFTISQLDGDNNFALSIHGGSGNAGTWVKAIISENLDVAFTVEESASLQVRLDVANLDVLYTFRLYFSVFI